MDVTRPWARAFASSAALTMLLAGAILDAHGAGQKGGVVRYLALGDSYTIGESVPEDARWPVQLAAKLREGGCDIAVPEIVARTGWTTGELSAALRGRKLAPRYELVSLLIGVNNQYRGLPISAYRSELRALLKSAVEFAGGQPGRVLVVSIPDWGVMPYAEGRDRAAIAREIDAFNAVAREEAARRRARWVEITSMSREAAADSSLVASDGLHPSARMYERWLERLLPAARDALGPVVRD